MQKIGLTGGIGSGKSLIANIFNHLNIPVFNADTESSVILSTDFHVRKILTEWFGEVLFAGGKPDRALLAKIIFTDHEALVKVNQLIHPMVRNRFMEWHVQHQNKPYVLLEAAILFESGFHQFMDRTILVTCPEEVRIQRVIARDRCTPTDVINRMKNQWSDELKSPLADYFILNDGISPVIPQILDINKKLIHQ